MCFCIFYAWMALYWSIITIWIQNTHCAVSGLIRDAKESENRFKFNRNYAWWPCLVRSNLEHFNKQSALMLEQHLFTTSIVYRTWRQEKNANRWLATYFFFCTILSFNPWAQNQIMDYLQVSSNYTYQVW